MMRSASLSAPSRRTFGAPAVRLGRFTARHLFSFEAALALFVYSNTIKFLLPSLPVDETALSGLLAAGAGGLVILRHGFYLRGLPIVAAGLAFIGWVALSWMWTPSTTNARNILTLIFSLELPCLVFAAIILAGSRERATRFIGFIFAISCGLAAYSWFIDLVYGSFRFYRGFADFARMYLVWGYAIANGAIIAFALLVSSRTFSARQIAAAGLFGLCTGFLLIGSGRGPLLAVILACLLAVVVGMPQLARGQIRVPRWQLMGLGILLLGSGYVVYLIGTGVNLPTFYYFTKLFNQLGEAGDIAAQGGANRFVTFAAAFEFWLRSPVLGNGVGSFSIMLLGEERPGSFPHNIFLEILCSLGLVGLVLFLGLLWIGGRHASLGRLRADPLLLCVAMLLVGQALRAMVSGDLGSHESLFLWIGLLALRPLPVGQRAAAAAGPASAGTPRLRPATVALRRGGRERYG